MKKATKIIDINSQEYLLKESLKQDDFKWFYDNDPVIHLSVEVATGTIVKCNKEAVRVLGYKKKKELVGRHISSIYSNATKNKVLENIEIFKRTGKLTNVEQEMITKDGKRIPVILNSNAVRSKNGQIIRSQSTLTDISKLKAAQKLLIKQKRNLLQANQDLEHFVSICSHDLKEPLGTIKFSSDVIKKMYKDRLDTKALEYLDYIMAAADRMATQITDLLDHAKLGKNVEREDINLNQLVEVVKYDLGKSISDKKAQILTSKLPKIVGYKTELRLLFQNLISNALKYTAPDTQPIIKINAQVDVQNSDYWLFSISDNGVGIPAEDLDRIFFIFNRLESNTKLEGHGVGLSHCQKIVNLHEGRIWATSKVGEGSTFFFTLKMYEDE